MKQPTAPPSGIPLYPELPITDDGTAGVSTSATSGGNVNVASQQQDQYFRLQEISRSKKHLEDEKDKRSQLYKKYRRGINAVDAVDTALISASMGMGIGGVGLLTTVIAAPVVLGLEIAALGCGLLGVAGKFIGRRLSVKAKKHDEVRVLAESKLNTIADHVSRALTDGQISDEEFRLIIDEAQNIPRWRQRSALEHRKLMLQSLSMRRQKTPSSNRAETRPGRVSWRSWLGPELCVPKEHLDAGMLLRMRQRKRDTMCQCPDPVEPLGRRGGGPSSRGSWATEPWFHFFICPPEFFLCGNLETSLGGCAGHGGGCGVWCRGGGVLGAVEGVLGGSQWGAVGVGAGSRGGGDWWGGGGTPGGGCWGPRRGRLVGWYGAPWGWVLRAALGAVEEVSGGRGGGCWGPGGGRRRRSAGGRGGRCWEPRRGRAGAPDSEYKHPRSPPRYLWNHEEKRTAVFYPSNPHICWGMITPKWRMYIYIYIYIYMGASHTLHSMTTIGFMPIGNHQAI